MSTVNRCAYQPAHHLFCTQNIESIADVQHCIMVKRFCFRVAATRCTTAAQAAIDAHGMTIFSEIQVYTMKHRSFC